MQKPPGLKTAITEMLGIEYPIFAAPMFLISDAKLTIAACKAGGTGAFPALNFRPVEELRKVIRQIKSETNAPFGVNIVMLDSNKHRDPQIDICLEEKVAYIVSSLGNPTAMIKKAHAVGTKVFCDVVSERHAQKAVDAGTDALIAVTSGAGGHAGDRSAFALIPKLKSSHKVPVIAAGSIVDGRTMLSAMALGADAVYIGTRFIACKEADAPEEYKKAIIDAEMDDIINSDRVDGYPGNFIKTEGYMKLVPDQGPIEKAFRIVPQFEKMWRLARASKTLFGKMEFLKASYKTVFSAGHGVGLIKDIKTAQDIVYSLVSEYHEIKRQLP
jgi:nitronate monooxygenase